MSEEPRKYSTKIRVSYGIGGFLDNFVTGAFTVRIFDFYENEIFLASFWVGIAIILYGVWNMFNDPLIGYLSDKSTFFLKKGWGRRFPWYLIGTFSYVWVYLLIFIVPFADTLGMFLWLLITIISFEGTFTLWQANYLALYPTKFRSQEERVNVGMWNTIWGIIGIALGVLLPPFIIEYGQPETFFLAGLMIAIIAFIMVILSIPGVREDEELKERQKRAIEGSEERTSFFKTLKWSFKDNNFIAYIVTYFGHQTMAAFMLASLPYWIKYIIGSADEEIETILSAVWLIFILGAGVPIWTKLAKKWGNHKAVKYGTLATAILFIPLIFATDLFTSAIFIAFSGVGIAAFWVLMYPLFSDVLDNIIVKTKRREEGTLMGVRTFFGRAPTILQGLAFALIHDLTGYVAGATPGPNAQTLIAQIGIRIHMAVIPMVFYFIGFLMMNYVYKLDNTAVLQNKELIAELKF